MEETNCILQSLNGIELKYTQKELYETILDHLVDKCGYDGVNLLNANDESAGQSVPHFHIHIIPRKNNDEIDAWPTFTGAKQELETIFKKVRMTNF